MTLVALDDLEIDDSLLDGPSPGLGDPAMLAALEKGFGEPFETSEPWRLLRQDQGTAYVAALSFSWDGWVVVRLNRDRRGGWSVGGSSYGVEVGPTRGARGAGLRLAWATDGLQRRRGEPWEVSVLLVNDRHEPVSDVISPHVHGDLDGEGVPSGDKRMVLTAIGLDLELEPGGEIELGVAVWWETSELPAGEYVLTAVLRDLGLRSEGLRVVLLIDDTQPRL